MRGALTRCSGAAYPISAEVIVHAIGAKILPWCRCSVKIGMFATMMISIEKLSVSARRESVSEILFTLASLVSHQTESRLQVG